MENHERNITFTIIYKGENYPIRVYWNEYYSLMTLISEQIPVVGFGLCCGMGSCGTCRVDLCDKYNKIKKSVLSCDILINDDLANTEIYIPDLF